MLFTSLNKIKAELNRIVDWQPDWDMLLKNLGKTSADDDILPLERILESNGLCDTVWVLSAVNGYQNAMRLYACFCARYALDPFENAYPNDLCPHQAIETAEHYARGQATIEELTAVGVNVMSTIDYLDDLRDYSDNWNVAWGSWYATYEDSADAVWGQIFAWYPDYAYRIDDNVNEEEAVIANTSFRAEFLRLCRLEGEYGEVDR